MKRPPPPPVVLPPSYRSGGPSLFLLALVFLIVAVDVLIALLGTGVL